MKYPAIVMCPKCNNHDKGFEAILKNDEVLFVCTHCGEVAFKVDEYALRDMEAVKYEL